MASTGYSTYVRVVRMRGLDEGSLADIASDGDESAGIDITLASRMQIELTPEAAEFVQPGAKLLLTLEKVS